MGADPEEDKLCLEGALMRGFCMIFKEEGGPLSSNRTSGPLQEAREYKRSAVQGCQVLLPESSISGLRIPPQPPGALILEERCPQAGIQPSLKFYYR